MLRQIILNCLLQSFSGYKAMLWDIQYVKCADKHVEQDDGRKSWGERQNSKKGFKKNEHACRVEGVFVVLDLTQTHCLIFKAGWPDLENSKFV